MTEEFKAEDAATSEAEAKEKGKHSWIEDIEVAGRDAVGRVQDLIEEGNVRRLIIMTSEERVLLEIPLTAGVVVGAGALWLAPALAAVGAVVAFVAKVKIRVVRVSDTEEKSKNDDTE